MAVVTEDQFQFLAAVVLVQIFFFHNALKQLVGSLHKGLFQFFSIITFYSFSHFGYSIDGKNKQILQRCFCATLLFARLQQPPGSLLYAPLNHIRYSFEMVVKCLPGDLALFHNILYCKLLYFFLQNQLTGCFCDDFFHIHILWFSFLYPVLNHKQSLILIP